MPVTYLKELNGDRIVGVNPAKEYIAGGILSNKLGIVPGPNGNQTLTVSSDDVMVEFGYKIYDQMMQDPKVNKCINVLKIGILGDGVELIPCVSDNHPEYDEAYKISEFCNRAIKGLRAPLRDTLEQMLDAMVYGHKLGEITYKIDNLHESPEKYLLPDTIKVKPLGAARFVVDKYFNVVGYVSNIHVNSLNVLDNKSDIEPITTSRIVERDDQVFIKVDGKEVPFLETEKFMVLTVRKKDEDPRGRSLLRPAFNSWHLKTQIYPEYLRYLLTCSIPLLVGYTPEEDDGDVAKRILRNPDGSPVLDASGKYIQINPVEALRDALLHARNATTIALKGGSKVQEISGTGAGTPFYKAIEVFDAQIETAILLQTLATSEGRFQTRAAATTHMSVLDQLIWYFKGHVADMLEKSLLRNLIRFNFGEKALKYMPKISLGDTERRDFSQDSMAISALYAAGYLSEDQKRHCDAMLGLPVRDNNYDPYKNITPTEALNLARVTLEQAELEAGIKKARADANLSRVQQLIQLKALTVVQTAEGTQVSTVKPSISKKIDDLIEQTLTTMLEDNYDDDTTRILDSLLNAGKLAHKILTPEQIRSGDENKTGVADVADTALAPPKPPSGVASDRPYIRSKGGQTSLSMFTKFMNYLDDLRNKDK